MKIISKEVKECAMEDGSTTMVLDLLYTHRSKKKKRILVKDYDDKNYDYILKQLRVKVREAYLEKANS